MKRALLPLIVGVAMCGTAANASVTFSVTDATDTYSGPAPTWDFESAVPHTGGGIVIGSITGSYVAPAGTPSDGHYFAAGPSTGGSPADLDLSSLGLTGISSISFVWGSVDTYNIIEVLDSMNNVLGSVTGADVITGGTFGTSSRLVTLMLGGGAEGLATTLRLRSNNGQGDTNAFEIDNVAVQAVPEASTWMMLILGMLGVGFAMRRRSSEQAVRIRYV